MQCWGVFAGLAAKLWRVKILAFLCTAEFFGYFFHGWKKVTPAAGET